MTKISNLEPPAAECEHATMYVAFELSKATWKIGLVLPGSQKMSRCALAGGDHLPLTGSRPYKDVGDLSGGG